MSTDWWRYSLECKACGNLGSLAIWDDDWNRWGANFVGFFGKVYLTGPDPQFIKCKDCGAPAPALTSADGEVP